MRVALCLCGKVGSKGRKIDKDGKSSPEILHLGHKFYKENLLDKYDVDVYIHSWSTDLEEEIRETYQAVSCIIEPQPEFPTVNDDPNYPMFVSRWHSMRKVVDAVQGNYDLVIISRFDIAWKIPSLEQFAGNHFFAPNHCCYGPPGKDLYKMGRNPQNLKEETHWHYDVNTAGVFDFWFASSLEDMRVLTTIIDNLEEIVQTSKKNKAKRLGACLMLLRHLELSGLYEKLKEVHHYVDTPLIRRDIFGSKN